MMGMGGMMMWPMMLGTLLVGLLLLVGVVWLIQRVWNRGRGTTSAEHILAERFARGEIDQEEYQQRRNILQH